jgi:drug/metabolite transporter (DMT)-like permease
MNRPLPLLLGVGLLLGLNFPLGKFAMAAGIDAAIWSCVISLGAGVAMLAVTLVAREWTSGASVLRYAVVSGFLSYVVPNLLTYSVIPQIGSGLTAVMFALSPVVTAFFSLVLRVRPPSVLTIAGIALGLAGALIIIVAENAGLSVGGGWWLAAGLLIPVFLAAGNVYRTLAWPKGASAKQLAALTNLAAVPMLLAMASFQTGAIRLQPLSAVPGLVVMQVVASTTMFLMFFRLQLLGGPTYLSQIGYVAAAVGVVIGVTFLGETYPLAVWAGTAVIAAGIALSTFAQLREQKARAASRGLLSQ